jgi:hypothetical protein
VLPVAQASVTFRTETRIAPAHLPTYCIPRAQLARQLRNGWGIQGLPVLAGTSTFFSPKCPDLLWRQLTLLVNHLRQLSRLRIREAWGAQIFQKSWGEWWNKDPQTSGATFQILVARHDLTPWIREFLRGVTTRHPHPPAHAFMV